MDNYDKIKNMVLSKIIEYVKETFFQAKRACLYSN